MGALGRQCGRACLVWVTAVPRARRGLVAAGRALTGGLPESPLRIFAMALNTGGGQVVYRLSPVGTFPGTQKRRVQITRKL